MFMTACSAEKFVIANFPITQQINYFSLQGLFQKGTKTQLHQEYPLFVSKDWNHSLWPYYLHCVP